MKKSIISVLLAVAVAVGGVTVYASSSKGWQAEQASAVEARKEAVEEKKAIAQKEREETAARKKEEEEAAAAAQKKAEEAAARKKAEEEAAAAAQKKAEEAAAQKKAEEEAAAAAQRQAEEAAAAAQQQAAAVQNSAAPAAADYNVVQAAPVETTVNTDVVYQPLCPYGHALVDGNMCAYPDCPNGNCYTNNNSYTSGGESVNYDYAGNGGQGYQYGGNCYNYGHGGGHHGHGCGR